VEKVIGFGGNVYVDMEKVVIKKEDKNVYM
jgi:hypothetical protein